jgi:hypothetical protein
MFRVVALIEPDIEYILRAKCLQYSIKASNILASRLKTLHDLCQGSLQSIKSRYQISVDSFVSVLRLFNEKQRVDVDSRPNSFAVNTANNLQSGKYGGAKLESISFFQFSNSSLK